MLKLKNSKIEQIFTALANVDQKSPDLDFAIKFKNKRNYRLLKRAYTSISETANEIFEKYGTQEKQQNGKMKWEFGDNKKIVDIEIKAIYAIEIEIDLKPVIIFISNSTDVARTDVKGLVISSAEMDILEDVFEFEITKE